MLQKVFITKYALIEGIKEAEMEVSLNHDNALYFRKCYILKANKSYEMFFDNEFHLTMEDAIKDAKKRQAKKIASLEKQLSKVKKITF
jgi:hypothetical protein